MAAALDSTQEVRALESEPDSEPVRFSFITFADDYSGITRTTDPVGEKEMRSTLHEMGMPEVGQMGISSRMERAPF